MRHRAFGAAAEVVVMQQAVLNDAVGGARRPHRYDDVDHERRAFTACDLIDRRHDDEQQQLLVVEDARRRIE
jgi:hypothetical protein